MRSLPFLTVLVLALVVAACGDEGGSSDGDSPSRDGSASERSTDGDDAERGGEQARGPAARKGADAASGGAIAISPAVTSCLERAGYEPASAPVEGSVATWRASDAVVAIAPSSEQALTIAGSVGTEEAPAFVDARIVAAGPPATRDAGVACLRAAIAADA